MSLRLLLFLARKSLFSSKLTVVLLTVAVAAGAGIQIANTANLDGFQAVLLEEGLTHGTGDVRVEPADGSTFPDGDGVAQKLRTIPGVRETVPYLMFPGAVGVKGRFLGTPIYGIGRTDMMPFHVSRGTVLAPGDSEGILIGSSLAKRLRVDVGEKIELRVIFGAAGTAIDEENLGRYTLTVRGVVSGSAGAYRFAFVDRAFLGAEAGKPAAASGILVHLFDHEAATRIAAEIPAVVPAAFAIGWRDDDPYLKNYLGANDRISSVSYAMVIAAVSIPMWALLYIHVLKRRREIGILVALGFGRREVFLIYLLQALVVVAIGCAIGALIGLGLIQYFHANPLFQWETLVVRPVFTLAAFLGPVLVITATALIAGSYPAWRAAKTDPAQVLRRLE
ncbi:MAG: ABC transporter permease [Deltaproteobacteria bacterium]|nr:ABC transporter permease [Deltaproteobacteria bacterium]